MENTTIDPGTDPATGSGEAGAPPPSRADQVARAFLALLVAAFGLLIAVLGPLFAVACGSCQDGVRDPRYGEVLTALAWYAVPATTLATLACLFLSRRGLRLGSIGVGVLAVLLFLILGLGQAPA